MFERLKNLLRLYRLRKDEAIAVCLRHDIPLTENNIAEIREILRNREKPESKS